jgi:hypothetical protein
MRSEATTVEEYLAELPKGRRDGIARVREAILSRLPQGFEEVMNWGMITYQVPAAIEAFSMEEFIDPEPSTEAPLEASLDLLTVAAGSVLVTSLSLVLRESARGLLFGTGGAAVNATLALAGWLIYRRGIGAPTGVTALAWLLFTINAWMATVYLIASPLLAFGDWMTLVDLFANRGPFRASLVATGLFISGLVWKETVPSLARVVGNGAAASRRVRGRRLAGVAWLAIGGLAAMAAVPALVGMASGIEATWGALPNVAGTFLATVPLLLAGRGVRGHPVPGAALELKRSWWVVAAGVLAAGVLTATFAGRVSFG